MIDFAALGWGVAAPEPVRAAMVVDKYVRNATDDEIAGRLARLLVDRDAEAAARVDPRDEERERNRIMAEEARGTATLGQCPRCNRPYGKRRRCYACQPPHPSSAQAAYPQGASGAPARGIDGAGAPAQPTIDMIFRGGAGALVTPPSRPAPAPPAPAPSCPHQGEFDAMARVVATIEPLTHAAAARVLAWASAVVDRRAGTKA